MTRTVLRYLFALLVLPVFAEAQAGFFIPRGQKKIELPFEYSNNFIILTFRFNGGPNLKFIFDTGAEHTILSKREITDILNIPYEREFRVTGSDMRTELVAYLVRNVKFEIPEKLTAPREDILVLDEDYFRFEEYAGVKVDGILSGNAFSRYIIRINYLLRVITLYERSAFSPPGDDYVQMPIEIFRNKPYLKTSVEVVPDSIAAVKLLLDTGAGLPMLLFTNTASYVHPPPNAIPTNIGMGLGGYLEGFTGRIHGLGLGKLTQHGIVTYFQTVDSMGQRDYLNGRNGLLGNGLLNRFNFVIDYQNAQIWLKPNKYYKEAFIFDRSGLNIIASGVKFDVFTVQSVLPNSPAMEADIRRGDEVVRIGITPTLFMSLADVQRALQKKIGKKVKIVIKRGTKNIKKTIYLRDLI